MNMGCLNKGRIPKESLGQTFLECYTTLVRVLYVSASDKCFLSYSELACFKLSVIISRTIRALINSSN